MARPPRVACGLREHERNARPTGGRGGLFDIVNRMMRARGGGRPGARARIGARAASTRLIGITIIRLSAGGPSMVAAAWH